MGSFEEDNPKLTSQEYAVMKDFLKFECFGFVIDWLNHDMPDDVTEKVKTLTRFVTRDMSGIK